MAHRTFTDILVIAKYDLIYNLQFNEKYQLAKKYNQLIAI